MADGNGYAEFDNISVRKVLTAFDERGPELVANGGFDDASVWSASPEVTIANGEASINNGSGGDAIYQDLNVPDDAILEITYTVTRNATGAIVYAQTCNDENGTNINNQSPSRTTTGTFTELLSIGNATGFRVRMQNGAGADIAIDNISVHEVQTLSLIHISEPTRPY